MAAILFCILAASINVNLLVAILFFRPDLNQVTVVKGLLKITW